MSWVFLLLAAVFWRMGRAGELKSNRMGLHWARLFLATIGQTGIFIAMVNLKLADATAFWFSKPLFTSVAAVFILAEIVPARRWVATMFGFAGVVIMMRPGIADIDPYVSGRHWSGLFDGLCQCVDPRDGTNRAA